MDAMEQIGSGWVTFLILTIGILTAIVLVIYYMTTDSVNHRQFGRVRDILTLIIAILATVTGFYFGSLHLEEPQVRLPTPRVEQMERELEAVRQIQSVSPEQAKVINQFLSLLDEANKNAKPDLLSITKNLFFAFVGALFGVVCQNLTTPRMIIAFVVSVVLFGAVVVLA
jgi:hypothetical protein